MRAANLAKSGRAHACPAESSAFEVAAKYELHGSRRHSKFWPTWKTSPGLPQKNPAISKRSNAVVNYVKSRKIVFTYNIPRVAQVRVGLHDKAHSDDLKHHFYAENDKEGKIQDFYDGIGSL